MHKRLFQQHPRITALLDADGVKWRVIRVTFATTKARLSEMISSRFQFQETTLPYVSIIHLSVKQDVTLLNFDEITWEMSVLHWVKSHQDPCIVVRSLFSTVCFFGRVISHSRCYLRRGFCTPALFWYSHFYSLFSTKFWHALIALACSIFLMVGMGMVWLAVMTKTVYHIWVMASNLIIYQRIDVFAWNSMNKMANILKPSVFGCFWPYSASAAV